MSAHADIRKDRLSPGLIALIGFLLMLAAFAVDVATNPASVHAGEPNVAHGEQTPR
jgi:hypothetical protein